MPTVTGNSLHFDMADLFNNSNFLNSVGQSGSATAFTTTYFSERWQFTGVSFGNFFGTIPTTGTIHTFSFYSNNVLVFTATGLSLPVPTLFDYMRVSDLAGLHNFIFAGADTITGSSAGDNLLGYGGNDTIAGGDGDDAITPGPGVDQVDGGSGNDILYLDRSSSSASFTFNTGLMASNAGQTLADGSVIRNIERYSIVTGSGNDTFNIESVPVLNGASPMSINGGGGSDTLIADFSSLNTWVTDYLVWSNIESLRITAGSFNDTLTGGSGDDQINGGDGNDTLSGGGGGVDILDGGNGLDSVAIGFAGVTADLVFSFSGFASAAGVTFANGSVVRNAETVYITGGDGNDTLDLGTDFFTYHSSLGPSEFVGGGGLDTVIADFSASNQALTLSDQGTLSWPYPQLNTQADRYVITGSSADDHLQGSNTATVGDVFNGGGGNDVIYLQGGADQIDGGAGTDTLRYRLNADQLNQSQTFDPTIFIGMSTAAGITLANGAVVRNMEILQAALGNASDTILVGSDIGGTVNVDGAGGFDTIEADFSGDTRQVSMGVNLADTGYLSFDGQTLTFTFNNIERFVVTSGSGHDSIEGYSADDMISGGAGNDNLRGGFGADTIDGGDGDDTVYGNSFSDRAAAADTSADTLHGGGGDDVLIGGAGADQLDGGDGLDLAGYMTALAGVTANLSAPNANTGDAAGDTYISIENLFGSNFDDVLTGNGESNRLTGGVGIDVLSGNAGADTLNGGDGADTLFGGDANDVLDGGAGADAMTGNFGDDAYYVDAAGDTVSEGNIAGGTDQVFASVSFSLASTGYADHLTLTGASAINGSGNSLNNTITGNTAANVLQGSLGDDTLNAGAGADTLYGGDGLDTLDGGTGADTMIGNLGDDTYYVDNAGDVVLEGNIAGGTDQVFASVTFNLGPTGYADQLTLTGSSSIDGFGNILGNTLTGNSGVNALWGNGGDDTLIAGDGADSLYGGDGADSLDGGTGADTMIGNFGNDTYYVDSAGDVVSEGNAAGGTDTVFASVSFHLGPTGFADHLTLTGASAINATGNSLANTLTGNSAANVLTGNAGNDVINGGDGADTLVGGDGADTLDGGTGADAMTGNAGDDAYYVDNAGDTVSEGSSVGGTDHVYASVSFNLAPTGFAENLTLTGSDAINATGNNLANTLTGNAAANTLTGAGGADSFVFASALGAGNVDAIADFSVVDDTIVLNNSVFAGLSAGALDAGAFVIGSAAADADDRIIYDSATGSLFFDQDGAGGADQILFATLTAGLALTNADFIVAGP